MEEELTAVLLEAVERDDSKAVMSFYNARDKKKYPVSARGYIEVMSWYCNAVRRFRTEQDALTLCEIPGDKVTVNICYKFVVNNTETIDITDEIVKMLVFSARNAMKSFTTENSHYDAFCCLVSEVESRCISTGSDDQTTGATSLDIRLQFPNLVASREFQKDVIIPRIKNMNLAFTNSISSETIKIANRSLVDDYVYNPIPLTGSTDAPGDLPFRITDFYPSPLQDDYNMFNTEEIEKTLLPSDSVLFQESDYDSFMLGDDPSLWYPMIASIVFSRNYIDEIAVRTTPSRSFTDSAKKAEKEKDRKIYSINSIVRNKVLEEDDAFELAKIFLGMWKISRFIDPFDFLVAGEGLYDATGGDEQGLFYWINLTKRSLAEVECEVVKMFRGDITQLCATKWYSFKFDRTNNVNLGFIAREDSPDRYEAWHINWCKPANELAISSLDSDVAESFRREYWLDYMFTINGSTKTWYKFARHALKEVPDGYDLRIRMSRDFSHKFRKMLSDIANENLNEKDEKDEGDSIAHKITTLINNLKSRRFKNHVLAEVADLFMVTNLSSMLDTNPDILGCPNGVLVFTDYSYSFRPGRPQDYVTKNIGCSYKADFTHDDQAIKDIDKWTRQVNCYDEDSHKYFCMHQAAMFRGVNRNKKVFCYGGEKADNSKSSTARVLESTMGDYCEKLPASKLNTSFENSEGPSPVMASLVATRTVIVDEPNRKKPLRTDTVKLLTSDTFRSRKMRENGGKSRPLFTMIIICNFAPEFDEKSKAIRNRWVIIPFDAVWTAAAVHLTEEEQRARNEYPIDQNFDDKAHEKAAAWLWYMLQYYDEVAEKGLRNLPTRIAKATEQYWMEKDIFYLYLTECIEDGTEEQTLNLSEIYEHFTNWHRIHAPSKPIPDQIEFSCEIYERWGRPIDGTWKDKRIKLTEKAKLTEGQVSGFGQDFGFGFGFGQGFGIPQMDAGFGQNMINVFG